MTSPERTRLIESRSWWHSIELGDGVVTPGQVPLHYLKKMLADLRFPHSFAGLSVLDIGAWDGFFSFEAEKRGAARVVAYDLHPPDYYGFATAKTLLESNADYVQGSVYDLSPEVVGTFDVVFFFGVLYHLRYPLLALDRIREVTDQYALIETHHLDNRVLLPGGTSCALSAIDRRLKDIALYQFYRNDELFPGDFSNWFALNRRAIEDGLWSAGFQPEFLATWDDRIAFKATKLPGIPEYQRQTYEGLKWQVGPDGSHSPILAVREVRLEPEQNEVDPYCAEIRSPKKQGAISYAQGAEDRIVQRLLALGLDVRHYEVDIADYQRYFAAGRYLEEFPDYYAFNRTEKSLEHYLAAKLLDLREHDLYIDIASEHSPAPDIYRQLFGVTAYRQDLAYRPGLHGDRIGGNAARMPVPDGFATKMALHCSFEHFEEESDIAFVREAGRVLRAGGAVCMVPLYLFEEYAIQADPAVAVPAGVAFEDDATVYCARGWGNRHGRFYDPEHLAERVLANARGMTVQVYRITNAAQVDPSCYVRFAMLMRKLGVPSDPGVPGA